MKDSSPVKSKVGRRPDNKARPSIGEIASGIARRSLRRVRFHTSTLYFRHVSSRKKHSALARGLSQLLRRANETHRRLTTSRARKDPGVIQPEIRIMNISLTSECIYGCKGCLYGRDFLSGKQLDSTVVYQLIDDARELQIPRINFYGGEPLLHPELVDFVEYSCRKGVYPVLGTNGLLLKPQKIEALYRAGLRNISIGVYGVGSDYDLYVDRADSFARLEENLRIINEEYPDIRVFLGWLLMRPTCNLDSARQILDVAKRHEMPVIVNLVHYDFPYFSEGHDRELQLFEEDRHCIEEVVDELLRFKEQRPELLGNTVTGLRSIPDWLILKEKMQVPCNMYDNVWVGPDGTVQVCQKNVVLGNANSDRLPELLHTVQHVESAQVCFELRCSNCHVNFDSRTCEDPVTSEKYRSARA